MPSEAMAPNLKLRIPEIILDQISYKNAETEEMSRQQHSQVPDTSPRMALEGLK